MERSLLNQIEEHDGVPMLPKRGVRLADVLAALRAGGSPWDVAQSLKLDSVDVIGALAYAALGGEADLGPALVQSEPKFPALADSLSERALGKLVPSSTRPVRLALAAGLLQMHDFWDLSHQAAQEADDLVEASVSAYWHGIAHRREPDPGNAAYWFRRVGRHPVFQTLDQVGRPLVEQSGQPALLARLWRDGSWNPSAMIDLCATAQPGTPAEQLARRLQRLEMEVLLGLTAAATGLKF